MPSSDHEPGHASPTTPDRAGDGVAVAARETRSRLTTPAAAPLRVVVAVADAAVRARLADDLAAWGHAVTARATAGPEGASDSSAPRPDVVLVDSRPAARRGADAEALAAWGAPAPAVVLVVEERDPMLRDVELAGGAFAVLSTRALPAQLECVVRLAAARGRELAAARADAAGARQELADRKTLERAKGILMRRTGSSEQEALRILEHSSETSATPLATLARAVLESEPGAPRA